MILPVNYSRTSSDAMMTAADMARICTNINEVCGASLKTNWTTNDIVDEATWRAICSYANALRRDPITNGTDFVNVNHIEHAVYQQYADTRHLTDPPRLTSLSITGGTLSPAFDPSILSYQLTTDSKTGAITATSDYSAIGYKVNGEVVEPLLVEWGEGANTVEVTATLNGQTVTYTVAVTSSWVEAELEALYINGDPITVDDYMTITTENASDTVTISAISSYTATLNGEPLAGDAHWMEGSNLIEIEVSASNTKVYTLEVNCLYEAPQPAYVTLIDITDSIMTPLFEPNVLRYEINPESSVSTIEVMTEGGIETHIYLNDAEILNGSEFEWSADGTDEIAVTTVGTEGYIPVTYRIYGAGRVKTKPLAPIIAGDGLRAGDPLPGIPFEG